MGRSATTTSAWPGRTPCTRSSAAPCSTRTSTGRRLGTRPERTAYVGDELDIDARVAVEAGLDGVWVDRRVAPRDRNGDAVAARDAGVQVIRSLSEPPGLVLA